MCIVLLVEWRSLVITLISFLYFVRRTPHPSHVLFFTIYTSFVSDQRRKRQTNKLKRLLAKRIRRWETSLMISMYESFNIIDSHIIWGQRKYNQSIVTINKVKLIANWSTNFPTRAKSYAKPILSGLGSYFILVQVEGVLIFRIGLRIT